METSLKLVEYSSRSWIPSGGTVPVGLEESRREEVSEESGAVHHIVLLLRVCNHIKKI